jgi:ribosomal 50S subunit-recycling heat shock protein
MDAFLKKTLIFKKREEAKQMCLRGYVKLNGKNIKPAKTINEGDVIEIETKGSIKRIKVLKIPKGNIQRDEFTEYYCELK